MIYLLLVFLTLAVLPLGFSPYRTLSRVVVIYIALLLIMLVALNFSVGQDYFAYLSMFEAVPDLYGSGLVHSYNRIHGEWGFLLVNSVLKTFGFSFNGVLLFTSSVSILIITAVSIRFAHIAPLALFIYFSLFFLVLQFVKIRMGLATSLVLLSVVFVYQRKLILSSAIIIIAASFQKFAITALVLLFLCYQPYKRLLWMLFIFSWILSYLKPLEFIVNSVLGIDLYVFEQLTHYSTKEKYDGNDFPILAYLYRLGLLGIIISLYSKFKRRDSLIEVTLITYGLGLFCLVAFWELSFIAVRLHGMFSIVLVILIPRVYFFSREVVLKRALLIFVIPFSLYSFYKTVAVAQHNFMPYTTILGL
ncbi:hypothetical protein A3765_00985 [Oleiphilus sp. HI0130]|nr:hypothetical protein A3765_00985 [Oleiphilus sp. HI0130]